MAEFTKEQLIEKLERRLAVTTHYPDFEEAQLDAQIFKIALEALTAGMEQEPVAWLLSGGGAKNNVSFDSGNAYADPLREVTPLYASPPAPVSVPDDVLKGLLPDAEKAEFWFEHNGIILFEGVKFNNAVFDACRAAMLQGADGNSPVIPDGWVACSERMPEVGVKVLCFPVNDEPIHATYNGQVWLQDISWSVSDEPIDNVISCNVTHWMPLPAAPQQE
ncbi:DUF551 domain-containing protein [Enterobacter hormaechei subsp. steigerwaltii]